MARDRESVQDAEMYKNEKINRMNPNVTKTPSFREQMEAMDKLESMTPGERLAALPWIDWERALDAYILKHREVELPHRAFRAVMINYRKELEAMHKAGTPLNTVAKFCKENGEQYLRW